ncbi:helix-turn-helix transcriptional regulator [Neorhizobium petrolearium]|uniref:helix-turn-helix transcriptional regulator n=1 Tax=Neorhizobium petrolearium TaxID=515361 RepID=UPI003F7E7463
MSGADVRMYPHLLAMKPAKRHLFRGQWLSVPEIAEITGIAKPVIYRRLKEGRAPDEGKPRPCQRFEFRGQRLTIAEIAQLTGMDKWRVYKRRCGDRVMDDDEFAAQNNLYREPHPNSTLVTFAGRTLSLRAWAREFGLKYTTLYRRWMDGWTMDRIAGEPVMSTTIRGTRIRNRHIITRLTIGFRRTRNQHLIHRMVTAFRTGTSHTPGYLQTFTDAKGTGEDFRKTQFDPELEISR